VFGPVRREFAGPERERGSGVGSETGGDRPGPGGRDQTTNVLRLSTPEEILVSAVQPPVDRIHASRELPNPPKVQPQRLR